MNFEFSDDQKELGEAARRFLEAECRPEAVRGVMDSLAPFDRAVWDGFAEMGFLGIAVPEAYGGLGLGFLELCVVAEQLGRVVAPIPFSSVILASECLLEAGTEVQKQTWLPKLAQGRAIGALALTERPGNLSPKSIRLSAAAGNDIWMRVMMLAPSASTSLILEKAASGSKVAVMMYIPSGFDLKL